MYLKPPTVLNAIFNCDDETMESMYRMWLRGGREGQELDYSVDLRGELQMALGTAKWQLEEFERAVRLSHGYRSQDNTTNSTRQFVDAMEDQIYRVEKALRESLNQEKQSLQWVHLDEDERDDLAAFLSGTPGTSQSISEFLNLLYNYPPVEAVLFSGFHLVIIFNWSIFIISLILISRLSLSLSSVFTIWPSSTKSILSPNRRLWLWRCRCPMHAL
ncbi:hypothetical protein IFM89_013028 [Coptis chinensis]|uniref:Syntaxin 6/10/61 N-terminal domain-containing protein n=1 Tax=Coptis chinensis TaxID=261450 RepID=A0A835LE69_9MAGN|nr:hypothetical protein IFM89_013028 [Coptis chinensis]